WYYKNMDASQEMFITADKYENEEAPNYDIPYLSFFYNQEKDFLQENLNLLEQKLSDHLLKLLEDFIQECDQSEDSSSDDNHSDKST
ncbi:12604_t:CDS:2, partial [Cetraspora pellucida]